MNELEKCAEILVEQGYGYCIPTTLNFIPHEGVTYLQMVKQPDPFQTNQYVEVDPFANNFEGMKQANAIEEYLRFNAKAMWDASTQSMHVPFTDVTAHQRRLDRIKWCINELIKELKE